MFVLGLTGGIGSGKTAVSNHFHTLGITIIDADLASRAVVEPGRPALRQIASRFGDNILLPDGNLDRAALRNIVFADDSQRQWLNGLTHPLIAEEIQQGLKDSQSTYTILVSPLLVETGQADYTQRILVVDVPESLQLSRTMARDNNSKDQVAAIIKAQADRQARLKYADDVINNDGDLQELHKKVEVLHQQYLELAK